MEEVEEAEGKDSVRAGPSCWKPAGTKELATAGGWICLGVSTIAVGDSDAVGAREIEQGKRCGLRWFRAGIADEVAELVRHA